HTPCQLRATALLLGRGTGSRGARVRRRALGFAADRRRVTGTAAGVRTGTGRILLLRRIGGVLGSLIIRAIAVVAAVRVRGPLRAVRIAAAIIGPVVGAVVGRVVISRIVVGRVIIVVGVIGTEEVFVLLLAQLNGHGGQQRVVGDIAVGHPYDDLVFGVRVQLRGRGIELGAEGTIGNIFHVLSSQCLTCVVVYVLVGCFRVAQSDVDATRRAAFGFGQIPVARAIYLDRKAIFGACDGYVRFCAPLCGAGRRGDRHPQHHQHCRRERDTRSAQLDVLGNHLTPSPSPMRSRLS